MALIRTQIVSLPKPVAIHSVEVQISDGISLDKVLEDSQAASCTLLPSFCGILNTFNLSLDQLKENKI